MVPENVKIVAVCDCDQEKLANANKLYPELENLKLTRYDDMRKLLDDKSIDAVTNGLGDRWHALSTVWACQAGKDSYVEKPGTHNIFEGRQMIAAARKYNRMVQHGTQNRSSPNIREGIQKLHEGNIGDLYMARGLDYKLRGNLGPITPAEVPEGLDWDMWLGAQADAALQPVLAPPLVLEPRTFQRLLRQSGGPRDRHPPLGIETGRASRLRQRHGRQLRARGRSHLPQPRGDHLPVRRQPGRW